MAVHRRHYRIGSITCVVVRIVFLIKIVRVPAKRKANAAGAKGVNKGAGVI